MLILAGADVNGVNYIYESPLHNAASNGNEFCVETSSLWLLNPEKNYSLDPNRKR